MQSSPPDLKSKNPLSKWLPAISLAVLINVIFIGIFLFSNQVKLNKTEDNSSQKEPLSSKDTEKNNEDISVDTKNSNNNAEEETLETLSEKNKKVSSETQVYLPLDANPPSEEDNLTTSASDSSKGEKEKNELSKDANVANNEANNKQARNNESRKDEATTQNPNLEYIPPATGNPNDDLMASSENSVQTSAINPNDRFLLPIDIPSSERSNIPQLMPEDEAFNEVSEETMRLNEQLTKAIDQVKEQKLRQIEEDQERIRIAYEKRQNTLGTSTNN